MEAHEIPEGTILVIDDTPENRRTVERLLTAQGYTVQTAPDGTTGLALVERDPPDIIILDVQMPGIDGFEVCRRIKDNPATRFIPVVLVTGLTDHASRLQGIRAGADDFLAKPFDRAELEARVQALLRLKRSTDELESAESVILSLALTVEARDPYTKGHCERLASYAVALGRQLGLSSGELAALERGGYLHDVGKIGIPDVLLHKETALTESEYAAIQQHPIIGDQLCGQMRSLAAVRLIVRHHHERLDGSGYPDHLRGEAIPLLARIIAIVDAYDAMTTTRPYRAAQPAQFAFSELRQDAAKGLFQADLVEAFISADPTRVVISRLGGVEKPRR